MQTRRGQVRTVATVVLAGCAGVLLSGCASLGLFKAKPPPPAVMAATYTATPIVVDGKLDEAVWQTAHVYSLAFSPAQIAEGKTLMEPGEVRLAWDDQNLYVAVKYRDSDVVAEGKEDQLHHYKFGDLAELFLKPENETWYWELYVTPAGKKTSFWFPGRGRLGLESAYDYTCGLRVGAQCQGTLNNWQDKDTCWTGEMAMPIKDLTARGERFGPGAAWRIMVSRYNYSRYLSWSELSITPQLSMPNYHLLEDYAVLQLLK